MRTLAGSVTVTDNPQTVHAEEHDVLVQTNGQYQYWNRLFARRLTFAPAAETDEVSGRVTRSTTEMTTQHRPARDLETTAEARELGIEGLVWRSCKPADGAKYTGYVSQVTPSQDEVPLLRESLTSPLTLAAIIEAADLDSSGEAPPPRDSVVWLPDIARSALREWVLFAFARWREHRPDLFPESAEWVRADRWASVEELDARSRLDEFDARESERLRAVAQARNRLATTLEDAESAGGSWRALLTSTGDELVAAVMDALKSLGFEVIDGDTLPEHKGAKREDLRVRDGEWTALVEVKGYAGAAKSNDLDQIKRAAVGYAIRERKEPDALWYVPNPQRDIDPSQRGQALSGRDEDLASFGDNYHGCLIDTRDLFELRQQVVTGRVSPDHAREALKSAVGRYTFEDSVVRNQAGPK